MAAVSVRRVILLSHRFSDGGSGLGVVTLVAQERLGNMHARTCFSHNLAATAASIIQKEMQARMGVFASSTLRIYALLALV